MPKQPRQKKYLSDAYLESKARSFSNDTGWTRMELYQRNEIAEFIGGGSKKRELHAESHRVQLLFRKERDESSSVGSKGTIIGLYVRVDDTLTKGDYIANWPIVAEYVRQLKEVQWGWSGDDSSRFLECLEDMRVSSNGKMGYGKLAQLINRRIEYALRAKKKNDLIEASISGEKYTKKWNNEASRKGYIDIPDALQADCLLRYFEFPEKNIKEIISSAESSIQEGRPLNFATGRHAYTGPVTAALVRIKLLKLRRHLSK